MCKGEEVAKAAMKGGCHVREGKGSHMVIKAKDGSTMAVYHGQLSKGVECKVKKWLLLKGIVFALCAAMLIGITIFMGGY